MPPTDNANEIEFSGRGGLVANVSAHDASPSDYSVFLDLMTDPAGRIRKRPGIGSAVGSVAGGALTAMYEFSLVNGLLVDYYLFRATDTTIEYRKNGGAWTATVLPYGPTAGGLWVFETVDKRCVACNGIDAEVVFDGTSNNWIIFGVEGPLTPLGYTPPIVGSQDGPYAVGTVTGTIGTKHIVGVSPGIWSAATMDGHQISINGITYTIQHVTVAGNGAGVAPEADLTENFKEVTAGGLPYMIFDGPCTWGTIAPTYGYGYYNPTTGHASNGRHSSLLNDNTLKIAETNQVGRKLTITGIAYSATAFLQGFTQILLFRTPLNGNILRALDPNVVTIANLNAGGSTSWTETAASFSDTALLNWTFQRTRLAKPLAGFRSLKYRQGRLVAIKENRAYFSLHELDVFGDLGVSSESWPSSNNRLLRADQVRGIVLIGSDTGAEALIIQTASGDFFFTGFDQSDISISKLPTRSSGSFQYGAIESGGELLALYQDRRLLSFPSDDDYGFAIKGILDLIDIAHLSEARLHRFSNESGDFILLSCRRTVSSAANDVTFVYDIKASANVGRPIWYQWSQGFTSFATAHNATTKARELWASRSDGKTFQLLQPGIWQDEGANFSPKVQTNVLRPWGETAKCDFLQAQIWVSNASFSWAGEFLKDEQAAGAGVAFNFSAVRYDDQVAQGTQFEWVATSSVRTRSKAIQMSITFPAQNSDLYLEKWLLVFKPGQAADVT